MKIISHRGNLNGPSGFMENHPERVDSVLSSGFDVEIDLWYNGEQLFLGHGSPTFMVTKKWLDERKNKLWVHLKNLETLDNIRDIGLNYFWHENDKMTLTSNGTPWCYPGIYLKQGITVVLDHENIPNDIFGICTDYPLYYEKR